MAHHVNIRRIGLPLIGIMIFTLLGMSITSVAIGQQTPLDVSKPTEGTLSPTPTKEETQDDSISFSHIIIGVGLFLLIATLIYVYRTAKRR